MIFFQHLTDLEINFLTQKRNNGREQHFSFNGMQRGNPMSISSERLEMYIVEESGELIPSKIDFDKLTNDTAVLILNDLDKVMWVWRGNDINVRKKFISARSASNLNMNKGLRYRIRHLEQGEETSEFLQLFGMAQKNALKMAQIPPETAGPMIPPAPPTGKDRDEPIPESVTPKIQEEFIKYKENFADFFIRWTLNEIYNIEVVSSKTEDIHIYRVIHSGVVLCKIKVKIHDNIIDIYDSRFADPEEEKEFNKKFARYESLLRKIT